MRWVWWVLPVLVLAAGAATVVSAFVVREDLPEEMVAAPPGTPMPGRLLVGFQDDVAFRWSDERAMHLDQAQATGAAVIRTIVDWSRTAPERPRQPSNPFDPAYRLDDVDELARSAQSRGIELLVSIWGTPEWANGGQPPNRPPRDAQDLQDFAEALADRYSGRHPGYPAVRLFSAWNEPNLEQFLAPQFDAEGRSVSPELYAPIARAVYDGVKRVSPEALVAIGETSPRGHDRPSRGKVQGSHSPARFARLLAEIAPAVDFDAWAQHPYPPRPDIAPFEPVRWPRVGMANLERFGQALDEWFRRDETPIWVTEYGHETAPDPVGVPLEVQARYAAEALGIAAGDARVRMLLWFIFRDAPGEPWQSGLHAEDGTAKPALAAFTRLALQLDARHPVVPGDAERIRLSALELAFHSPVGAPIEVEIDGQPPVTVPLRSDGWIELAVDAPGERVLDVRAANDHGHAIERRVSLGLEVEATVSRG